MDRARFRIVRFNEPLRIRHSNFVIGSLFAAALDAVHRRIHSWLAIPPHFVLSPRAAINSAQVLSAFDCVG